MTNASARSFLLVIALFGFLGYAVSGNNFNLSTAIAPVTPAFHGNQQGFVENLSMAHFSAGSSLKKVTHLSGSVLLVTIMVLGVSLL